MGGWHLWMTWGQEVCYTSLHSEPLSALNLPTVWLHWGNTGVARCWEMTLCAERCHWQAAVGHWVSLCVWSVVGWLIVYQDGDYLYPGQYNQTICWLQIGWYCLWGGNILMARTSTFLKAGPGNVMTVQNLGILFFTKDMSIPQKL